MCGGSTGRTSTIGCGGDGRRDDVDEAGGGAGVPFFFRENRPIVFECRCLCRCCVGTMEGVLSDLTCCQRTIAECSLCCR